jgi:hypothetical protein
MDMFKTCCAMFLVTGFLLGGMYLYVRSQTATIVYVCSEVTKKDPADVQRICKYAMKWK